MSLNPSDVYQFLAGHDDLIHDIAYNFYGKRLATCSSDQKIKVFDMDDHGRWIASDSWKAHDASVIKLSWAHPEFGNVIASCSFDRSIKVFEESEYEAKSGGRKWLERAKLTDSRYLIQDIQFAPHHFGLKIASISADGRLRIYEAMDFVDLSAWTLQDDILVSSLASVSSTTVRESDGHFCLSWNPSRAPQPMIVVGCGKENMAKIWRCDAANKWSVVEQLKGHTDVVLDVAWAPNLGKSFHLIATACKDQKVRIFKVTEETTPMMGVDSQTGKPRKSMKAELVQELIHGSQVWTIEWNITGTLLSSSGDDGKIKIWKASYNGPWQCMTTILAEENHDSGMSRPIR